MLYLLLFAVLPITSALAQARLNQDLKRTVILISLDGFRPDYLDKYKPRNIAGLARRGVRARWLIPSFPTLTFPNHYTIATGLYPQNNGIVGNTVYDPASGATLTMGDQASVGESRWWLGEPIWVTAEKQNVRSAAFFFPGTEAEIGGRRPTFWKKYDGKISNASRVDQVLSWLNLPQAERPQLFLMYFSDVDTAAQRFSPVSTEVAAAVGEVDAAVGRLLSGLDARGIREKVNIVLVSDHGMASVKPGQTTVLDNFFDASKAAFIAWGGTVTGVFPKQGEEDAVYRSLIKAQIPGVECYGRENLPERFRYRESARIAPINCVANEGWLITSRDRSRADEKGQIAGGQTTGAHGYDNRLSSMRATFIASGPAFKKGINVDPFENVSVYNILAKALRLKPAKNDGSFGPAKKVLK